MSAILVGGVLYGFGIVIFLAWRATENGFAEERGLDLISARRAWTIALLWPFVAFWLIVTAIIDWIRHA